MSEEAKENNQRKAKKRINARAYNKTDKNIENLTRKIQIKRT
ncbi:hypothetical protein [Okeania sp.]|nr:hypothetical protein [Okeania sp.]MEB3340631.1 hypothetical protein [Okeania sp.]